MKPLVVLAVDDREDDLTLLSMAFRKSAPHVVTRFSQGGEDAMAYMRGQGKYADRTTNPLPRLVLLDLKMPRVDGFDVLRQVRSMPLDQHPYVAILSSSDLPKDKVKADELGADLFTTKPTDFESLCQMVEKVTQFFSLAPARAATPSR